MLLFRTFHTKNVRTHWLDWWVFLCETWNNIRQSMKSLDDFVFSLRIMQLPITTKLQCLALLPGCTI